MVLSWQSLLVSDCWWFFNFLFLCVDNHTHFISLGISAALPPTNLAAVNSASYEGVDIDNCVRPTL